MLASSVFFVMGVLMDNNPSFRQYKAPEQVPSLKNVGSEIATVARLSLILPIQLWDSVPEDIVLKNQAPGLA